MPRLMDSLIGRWRDGAAVRAEHELDPTRRRRFDRLPQHFKDRRALRAERRLRAKGDIGDAARMAESTTFIRR